MQFIQDATEEKLRGGFYTPEPIAKFMLKWAINGDINQDILEPSCGDGVFLRVLRDEKLRYKSVTAIELDAREALKADIINLSKKTVLNNEFHTYCNNTSKRFDLIIGNPPYIRYQYFDRDQRIEAEKIFSKVNLKYSKLTNAWVSFVVGASLLLKEKGKIGFVLPAEILQVSYAKQLRNFLAHFYNKISIVSFKKLVFQDIQQEVVLLLCEKTKDESHRIEHFQVYDEKDLERLDISKIKKPTKRIDFKSNKWTFYFLDQKEIDFLEELMNHNSIPRLGDYAKVEVGITTGSNDFFTVPLSTIQKYRLQRFAKPMVGRSVQVSSIIFTKNDWKFNVKLGARAYLLKFFPLEKLKNNKKALEYIRLGETKGINKWYKCRIRDEWQIIPSDWISEALFIRRNNIYSRLIINKANAYTTDTMHRVAIKEKINLKALTASYYNSLSLAFTEICGRSHGGGALELMPNEVESVMLPYNEKNADIFNQIDQMMREGKSIDEILKFTDKIVLRKSYGFSEPDIKIANNIWKKLSARRLNRGNGINGLKKLR